jgi:diguanylate cyclase (GGDEF)-like protein
MSLGFWRSNGDIYYTTMIRDISERKKMEDQLKYLATTDHLTGILNRRTGLMLIEQSLKTAKRIGTSVTICYFDLDNFKQVNDVYGHVEGDNILKEVATVIKKDLREADIFCRLGGDEFIIAWNDADLKTTEKQWARILNNFNEWKETKPNINLGVSAGFVCPDLTNTINIDKIIDLADKEMYKEKARK